MIRKATEADLNGVLRLYDEMHDAQEAGLICTNWKRGIYPSRVTAIAALERNNLFVTEENGRIIGDRKSTRLNSSHRHTSRMPSSA